MARVDHRGPLVAQAADAVQDVRAALRVNGDRGLVEEDELGAVGDAAGDVEPSRQAAGELARAKAHVVAKAHKVNRLVHQLAAPAAVAHVECAEGVHVLAHGELVEDGHLLRDHAHARLEVIATRRHRLAEELDGAAVVGEQLEDAVDCRGLARAVGAQEAKDLPLAHGEVQVIERDELAIALDETRDADDVLRWCGLRV